MVLRLNRAVAKENGAKLLGERIAKQLQAHVAQTVGDTCLLYRPGIPKVLDLEAIIEEERGEASEETKARY
jgi:RNA-binding protein YhbY